MIPKSWIIKENIYGHKKRLKWIISHIHKYESIVEVGCGTGYMISLRLAQRGFNILGVDIDERSIDFGRRLFAQDGFDMNILKPIDISELDVVADVIIASEVLEHIPDEYIADFMDKVANRLCPGGKFLVTVPNGYGWFELESLLWFKCNIGSILQYLQVTRVISIIKRFLLGPDIEAPCPSTLSDSPHVQHFTYTSIKALLRRHGFEVESTGSVLFAGPFSNLLFTGIKPIMMLNCILGKAFPRIAAGFYVACRLQK